MLQFELDNELVKIPTSPKEVTAEQYEEFKYLYRKYIESPEDLTAVSMTNCLLPVLGDWVLKLDFSAPDEGLSDEGLVPTVQWLFYYLCEVIVYEDKDLSYTELDKYEATIDGENYYLRGVSATNLIMPQGHNLNVQEAIECERAAKAYNDFKESKSFRECDLAFTFDITLAAILLRKDGEQLPIEPSECELFIEQRKAFFAKHLTLHDSKNLLFFFNLKLAQFSEMLNLTLTQMATKAQTVGTRKQRRSKEKQQPKLKPVKIISLNTQISKQRTSKA